MAYRGIALDNEIIGRLHGRVEYRQLWRPDTRGNIERRRRGMRGGRNIDDDFTQVGDLWVPNGALRPPDQVRWGSAAHPRGLAYDLDALTRIRMAVTRRPDWIAHSWSAARLWGMPYFCDDADTCVLSGGRRRSATTAGEVSRYRREGTLASVRPWYRVDREMPDLGVTPPSLTVAHCLRSLRAGDHAWSVPPGTGLDDRTVRAVQFVDAACDLFGCDPSVLVGACGGQYSQRDLARIATLADRGAESPMESVMRLQVERMFGGDFISQLVVHRDGSVADPVHSSQVAGSGVVARVDLGSPTLKLALQYDGSGHLERSRRDRDSRVTAALANLGWHVLRLTYGHLRDPGLLECTVAEGIALCQRRDSRTP
jgi:hypothetical protein